MAGIFIIRGMTLTIPAGGLVLREDGSSTLDMHVRFDVVPVWLAIARNHAEQARARNAELLNIWNGADEDYKAQALESEFVASMQAIVAAATAIEALYSVLRPISLPEETAEKWKTRRPKHYKQIAEVCRIAFQLPPRGAAAFQRQLEQIFLFRDRAIHPSGIVAPPLLHPELAAGMDPRLVWFRSQNATLVVQVVSEHLVELVFKGRPLNDQVERCAVYWQERFKAMFPDGLPLPVAAPP